MYNAELGYKYGFSAFAAALISGFVMIIIGRTGFVISRLRQLKLMTVPEFFEVKYSRGLRLVTGVLVALGGILNMGVFLKIEGEFLTIVSGINAIANPKFGVTFIVWQILLWFSIHTCWQTTAMRMFSTKSPETSKRVMTWTGFIFLGRGMLPMLWGIAALTLFGVGALEKGV